jgi:hypothetical protein
MSLPKFTATKQTIEPLNPIFESLFEVRFTGITSDVALILQNSVANYKVLAVEESTTKMLRIDFEINVETIKTLLSQLNYIQSVEIIHHDKKGNVIYGIGSNRLRLNRFTAQGDYSSTNLQKISVYWGYLELEYNYPT